MLHTACFSRPTILLQCVHYIQKAQLLCAAMHWLQFAPPGGMPCSDLGWQAKMRRISGIASGKRPDGSAAMAQFSVAQFRASHSMEQREAPHSHTSHVHTSVEVSLLFSCSCCCPPTLFPAGVMFYGPWEKDLERMEETLRPACEPTA